MLLLELVYNLSVLVALSVLSAFIEERFDRTTKTGQFLQGLLFGSIALVGMLYPLKLEEGLIFDGRTVVISLCSLFFGPFSGGISALIPAIYRISLGGPGLAMGVATILTAALFGTLFFYWYTSPEEFYFSKRHLLILGILVHGAMLLETLLLPGEKTYQTLVSIGPTIAITFPLATVLIGKILMDQIERKQYLLKLQDAAERYRTTLESLGDAVIATDHRGIVEFLNPVAETLTGFSVKEAVGKPIDTVFHIVNEETKKAVENPVNRVLREGVVVGLANHTVLLSKDGREVPIADSGAPIRTNDGKIRGVVLVFRDQSTERRYLKQLAESEQKYRSLFLSTTDGVAIHELVMDPSGNPVDYILLDVNPGFERITGLSRESVMGRRATEVYQNEPPPYLTVYARVVETGDISTFESYYPPMQKYFHITVFSPAPGQFATVFQDITERKLESERIRRELEEKNMLLREIHHRVKNNLQVILSFIRLRIAKTHHASVKKELSELENRIHAMARAQELLYESQDFLHLGLKQYVTDVLNHLLYSEPDKTKRIHFTTHIEEVRVSIDTAIAIGHILTELVFNIFQHAFPENRTGDVRIHLSSTEDGVLLKVEDTGVGFPPGTALEDIMGTGLEIVLGYVHREIGGKFTYESSNGLHIRILIPYTPAEN
ncbi:MAG: PAS domain S-box protein [Spirochaetes bacterium]|nr:PAS domain S-box protein [Spirochaetota bacterium]